MFRKKQSEFQYAPGIEKIIEDIQGGGTIARAELKGIIDELPPLVMVGKDTNGLYHIVKTGRVTAVAAADAVAIQVAKNHVFKVGEAVTIGGALTGASDVISAIDKTAPAYDTITLAGPIGAVKVDDVLVLVTAKAAAKAAKFSCLSLHCSKLSFSKLKRSFNNPSFRNLEILSRAICTNTVPMIVAIM